MEGPLGLQQKNHENISKIESTKSKHSTPVYQLKNFPSVYEPSEDTFLLLDALEKDENFIKTKIEPLFCWEIGYI
jgi:hypothetical protein